MKNETIISNHKNNETIITTTIRLMYIMLEEELYELDWKCLKKNYMSLTGNAWRRTMSLTGNLERKRQKKIGYTPSAL